ncbi:solute carrier family 25 member 35-like [Daktulosphaira vitifoliae]|uniref:solute carrier family 25 member 35-like n=1 Tax=Daktulosphaira vitifoliae TaxID=58002 RepID=UPI0021A9E8CF|nr:solute carrier family 25 member 35-like [Daktulosphaira vitifoliae]
MEFLLGAAGASGAVCFTNPLEVIKTRFQLQGELKKSGKYSVHYRNVFHAFYVIAKHEGIVALQKGLMPAMGHQVLLNGTRFGIYDLAEKHGWLLRRDGTVSLLMSVLVGAGAGAFGGFLGSPLYLVKVHLQSLSAKSIAVGHQHSTTGTLSGLRSIYSDYGITRGLWRGATGAMVRISVGSSVQLSTMTLMTESLVNKGILQKDQKIMATFITSMIGGVFVAFVMAPFDLVSTRLYNQGVDSKGRGLLYRSYIECLTKTFKQEGVQGLYKGFLPCYMRLGPHLVLSMVFWDTLRQFHKYITDK